MRCEAGRRWMLCENSEIVVSPGNSQNFVVDIFKYFYSTLCGTLRQPLHCFRYSRWYSFLLLWNTREITGWQESVNFQNGRRILDKQLNFNRVEPKTFHRVFFRVIYFRNRLSCDCKIFIQLHEMYLGDHKMISLLDERAASRLPQVDSPWTWPKPFYQWSNGRGNFSNLFF